MSIASDLTAVATNLNSALDEINTKIEAKGGTVSETVYGVAAAVENLPSGGEDLITKVTVPFFSPKIISDVQHYNFSDFSEFTEVEYIESTGTQWINTEILINKNHRYVTEFEFTATSVGIEGATSPTASVLEFGKISGSSNFNLRYGSSESDNPWIDTGISIDVNKHTVDMYNGNQSLDGTQYGSNTMNDNLALKEFHLFARTTHLGLDEANATYQKKYSAKIYESGLLIRNYVPCYHTATGIIGMFDTVNNKFYMNAGTGTFLKGADI